MFRLNIEHVCLSHIYFKNVCPINFHSAISHNPVQCEFQAKSTNFIIYSTNVNYIICSVVLSQLDACAMCIVQVHHLHWFYWLQQNRKSLFICIQLKHILWAEQECALIDVVTKICERTTLCRKAEVWLRYVSSMQTILNIWWNHSPSIWGKQTNKMKGFILFSN